MKEKQNWLLVVGLGVGVVFAAGLGIFSYLRAMTSPIYSSVDDVPSSAAGAPAAAWTSAVEQGRRIARDGVVNNNLPAMSVAVGVGGEIVWAEAFGWADVEKRTPATPATRFRIGHASKTFTSAGVGVLLEQGKLHLAEEIQTYVPDFPKKEYRITLGQLMGHVAGIRHYRSEVDYMPTGRCQRASEGLRSFADHPLLFEPGTQYKYSTFGWVLVSAAVEAVANEPFFSFMRRKVFEPAGMVGTAVDAGHDPMPDRATFYYPRMSGDTAFGPEGALAVDYSCFAGAGAFLSTPSDMVRFAMALQQGKLLQRETVERLQAPQLLPSGEETGYGLGWMLETLDIEGEQVRVAGHASRTPLGGSTSFLTLPDRGIAVAVTSNISFGQTRLIAEWIAEAFAKTRRPGL